MKLKTLNENLNGRDLKRQILKCIREVQVSDDFTDEKAWDKQRLSWSICPATISTELWHHIHRTPLIIANK